MRTPFILLSVLMIQVGAATSVFSAEFLALDHVALHVRDLQTSADWYAKCFGFSVLHKWSGVWMVGRGNMKIGLYLSPNAETVGNPDKSIVMDHFALSVDGDKLQNTLDELKAKGIRMTTIEDTGIAYSVFLKDPDGYSVEVTSYHGPGATPPH